MYASRPQGRAGCGGIRKRTLALWCLGSLGCLYFNQSVSVMRQLARAELTQGRVAADVLGSIITDDVCDDMTHVELQVPP